MMKSSNEVLDQIKSDRIELLKLVRDSITSDQSPVLNNIDTTLELISKDEEATKQLETITKAKEMISTLMTSAALATTDEELITVRKSLNYYLNKVKKEIQKREMSEELYDKYYESMSYLRNDISECLRAMKRQVKLDKLTALIDSGTLTAEELKELKAGLNNEKRFNKRLLEKYGSSEGVQRKPKKSFAKVEKKVQPSCEELKVEFEAFQENGAESSSDESFEESLVLSIPKIESSSQDDESIDECISELKELIQTEPEKKGDTILSTWQSEIKSHYYRYGLEPPREYGCHLFKNVGTLFSNIGIYYRNKNRAKQMIYDYNIFCRNESLHRLIDYTLYNNSIKEAVGQIFRKTALGRHESIKEREHRYYMEEIRNAITTQNTTAPVLVKA